ncbi:sucrase-isomaltase, intestinal-like [Paramacrobiotus metropolitanus]|uniref:sucrase-isomaltase, intestinal-like n=1 Tax=Paramacrobiotus metropolitanus TaxID=2943436 RepID=UPI00244611E6|nr:sucrase-isomaltase, intestinal-like [Paramacrobiotus metropolitanus]
MRISDFVIIAVLCTVQRNVQSLSPIPPDDRIDCAPGIAAPTENQCSQHCVFDKEAGDNTGAPSCYMHPDTHSYRYAGKSQADTAGWTVVDTNRETVRLELQSNLSFTTAGAIRALEIEFERYSTRVMGFRIRDADSKGFQVPRSIVKLAIPRRLNNPFYRVEYVTDTAKPFSFRIVRRSTNVTLLDTSLGGMVFEEKFIQFVTKLASKYVYGLGENQQTSFRREFNWKTVPLFSRRTPANFQEEGHNYAGVHPFVMVAEKEGNAHGIFLLNSNAMEYKLQPTPALTLRTFGGVLEFLICFGATPNDVIIEYTQTIGRPAIPPYWALGLHESAKVEDMEKVVTAVSQAGLPLDALHVYAKPSDREWSVTVYKEDIKAQYRRLKAAGGHALVVVPPHIRVDSEDEEVRAAYQDGLWRDIFVKWPSSVQNSSNNSDISPGSIGPGGVFLGKDKADQTVVFLDFFNPRAAEWWDKWLTLLHRSVPWDGFRLGDNQPYSHGPNMCSRTCRLELPDVKPAAVQLTGGAGNSSGLLSDGTLCMGTVHNLNNSSVSHYDVHNLYGLTQAIITKAVAERLTKRRSIVFTTSNFPTSGTVSAIFMTSTLEGSFAKVVRNSITAAFNFNMFGITVAGANVESAPSDESLCRRWQVFSLFHVLPKSVAFKCLKDGKEPYSSVISATKKALQVRYTLLPYLYTLFFHGWMEGEAIMRHLIYEYNWKNHDLGMMDVDDQFFWGSAVMFVPRLDDSPKRNAYIPYDTFYCMKSGKKIVGNGSRQDLDIPIDEIGVYLRAGYIIPTQPPNDAKNTKERRRQPYGLMVASHIHTDGSVSANGNFWMDDGETTDTIEKHDYMSWFIYNRWKEGNHSRALLDYDIERNELGHTEDLHFGFITVYGYEGCGSLDGVILRLDGTIITEKTANTVDCDAKTNIMMIKMNLPLNRNFKLEIIHKLN